MHLLLCHTTVHWNTKQSPLTVWDSSCSLVEQHWPAARLFSSNTFPYLWASCSTCREVETKQVTFQIVHLKQSDKKNYVLILYPLKNKERQKEKQTDRQKEKRKKERTGRKKNKKPFKHRLGLRLQSSFLCTAARCNGAKIHGLLDTFFLQRIGWVWGMAGVLTANNRFYDTRMIN